MTFLPKVQEVLDREFKDIFYPTDTKYHKEGDFYRFGEQNRYLTLMELYHNAQDLFDNELAEQAKESADSIQHPGYLGDKRREAKERPSEEEHNQGKTICKTYAECMKWNVTSIAHRMFHDSEHSIVVFKEKHGDRCYDIGTATKTATVFLTILDERLTDDYWFSDKHEEEPSDQMDLLSNNEVPLTEKQEAEKILAYARSDKPGALIKAGKAAYWFLYDRNEHQYEEFEVIKPEVAEFKLKED